MSLVKLCLPNIDATVLCHELSCASDPFLAVCFNNLDLLAVGFDGDNRFKLFLPMV